MSEALLVHTRVLSIVGDMLRIALPAASREGAESPCHGDLAEVRDELGRSRLAQVIRLDDGVASLQVFSGSKGLSTRAQCVSLVIRPTSHSVRTFSVGSSPETGRLPMAVQILTTTLRSRSAARRPIHHGGGLPPR